MNWYSASVAKNGLCIFTGANRYALDRERRRWEKEFCARHGEENLVRRPGAGLTLRQLLDDVAVAPFLAQNRLVVVDGVPKFTKQEVEVLVQHRHPSTVLLFIDKPSKGSKGPPKDLAAVAEVRSFADPKGPQLLSWIAERAGQEGIALTPEAARRLSLLLQHDQEFLDSELQKLGLLFAGRTLTPADLDSVVLPLEGAVWAVTDAVVAGRAPSAVLEARRLLQAGADPMMLWNAVLGFVHNAFQLAAAADAGITSAQEAATHADVHPFVARTLFPFAKSLDRRRLASVVERAVEFDIALKTGLLRLGEEGESDVTAATDALLLAFA